MEEKPDETGRITSDSSGGPPSILSNPVSSVDAGNGDLGANGEELVAPGSKADAGYVTVISPLAGEVAAAPLEMERRTSLQLQLSLRPIKVSLEWRSLTYSIVVGKSKEKFNRVILKNLSGYLRSGSFLAILGPTGSGKTSLLNALAGRLQRVGKLEGGILCNNMPRDVHFRRVTAYVMQDDLLYSSLTVYETLWTAAMLRLPSTMSTESKVERVQATIHELGLGKARDTIIGNDIRRGVSGGERKRVNIAVEMLSNPSLIFLDEPTSGLDSFQALNVMSTMAALAASGRTVVSTIHQPRSSIYALFQDLLLLSEGEAVYSGPSDKAVDYFAQHGLPCPMHYNPADFFMDQISVDTRDLAIEKESLARVQRLHKAWAEHKETFHRQLELPSDLSRTTFDFTSRYASWWWTQFQVLLWRSFVQVSRDRIPITIAFVQAIVMGCVVGALYSDIPSVDTAVGLSDATGVIFFLSIFVAFNGVFQMITTFPVERGIVSRERAANAYRVSAFYPAKVIAEWPIRLLPSLIFVTLLYWIIGFKSSAGHYFIFLLCALAEFSSMHAVGLMISAMVPTPAVALAVGPLITVIMLLFGGFYINVDSIPVWLRWLTKLSPITWAFGGYVINEFGGSEFGDNHIDQLGFGSYTVWETIAFQFCVMIMFHLLAYIFLRLNRPHYQPLALNDAPSNGPKSVTPTVSNKSGAAAPSGAEVEGAGGAAI